MGVSAVGVMVHGVRFGSFDVVLNPSGVLAGHHLFWLDTVADSLHAPSMASASMDPEEVRRFAEELKRFNADLQNNMGSLQARFQSLGDTWQDREHEKFAEEFQETMKVLRKFIESSNTQAPFLMRKAARIREYLDQR